MPEHHRQNVPVQGEPEKNVETQLIRLRVGECQFTTTLSTLTNESTFFASMFSGDWNNPTTVDGVTFIDSDGHIFRHILAYLRSGRFPLFYDAGNHEFDFAQYQALLGEAKFFGIPRLQQWIEQHRYRDAIEVQRCSEFFNNRGELTELLSASPATAEGKIFFGKKAYSSCYGVYVATEYEWNPKACLGEDYSPEDSAQENKH
ncbi:hypothetical protein PG985_001528 [Apiospora marii]|uniref:BTB domain-containing protein n=1 Tax=Apiospora marii TaxID=335849 RepID=A0ABR1RI97_9PEZI